MQSAFLIAVSINPQMEKELEHMRSSLQDASQQISDLNMQQTIMTSGVTVIYFELFYSLCSQRRAFTSFCCVCLFRDVSAEGAAESGRRGALSAAEEEH